MRIRRSSRSVPTSKSTDALELRPRRSTPTGPTSRSSSSAEPSIRLLERALRAGARDVVAPQAPAQELCRAFDDALDAANRRRGIARRTRRRRRRAGVICVISPKGGAGKTTVSTNLATGLARAAPGEVVIVDLDFQFGDVASSLRMMPEHTFTDIVRTPLHLDIPTLKVYPDAAPTTGLFALCAPDSPADADRS